MFETGIGSEAESLAAAMGRDERALHLIGQIYRAAVGEVAWQDIADELSEAYAGSLVCLCLGTPDDPRSRHLYTAGLPEDFGSSLWRSWVETLPWNSSHLTPYAAGFASAEEAFPDLTLEDSDFYRRWMAPRGLPAAWPICLSIATQPAYPEAAIVILRQPGAAAPVAFSQGDIELGNLLLPHLRRGLAAHAELAGIEWSRRALQEVVDRLRLGVILLDSEGRLLKSNRSADRSLVAEGGLMLRERKLCAARPDDDRRLHDAIARASDNAGESRFHRDDWVLFERGGEGPNMECLVKPLLSGAPGSVASDAVVAVLIASYDEVSTFPLQTARRLYSLTDAEAELVQLLLEGASLQQAAERRGVAVATVRGQLRTIFSKTGTNRQSELVHAVLAGVTAVWDAAFQADLVTLRQPAAEAE